MRPIDLSVGFAFAPGTKGSTNGILGEMRVIDFRPMRFQLRLIIAILAILQAAACTQAGAEERKIDEYAEVRGMTISCAAWGAEWGTDEMVETMAELKSLGVNWIAIHPYAQIREDGMVLDRYWRENPRPEWLTRPIAEAHRLGLKMLIKPHIAYWGTDFSWRGDIEFTTDDEWRRFFVSYSNWIEWVVSACSEADAFAVGTELDRTVHFEEEWRTIIDKVRARTDAPVTYAANWSDYRSIPFWDALDLVGIQWYFPVADSLGMPQPAELQQSWERRVAEVGAFADSIGKRIVLTELGYNRSSAAAVRPWEYHSGGPGAEEVQRRCISAALEAIDRSDSLVGAFLWKWFPGSEEGRNFILSTPAMREVIADHWSR